MKVNFDSTLSAASQLKAGSGAGADAFG